MQCDQEEVSSCRLTPEHTKLVFKVMIALLQHLEQYGASGTSSSRPAGQSAEWHAAKYEAGKPRRHSEDPVDITSRHQQQYRHLQTLVRSAKSPPSQKTQPALLSVDTQHQIAAIFNQHRSGSLKPLREQIENAVQTEQEHTELVAEIFGFTGFCVDYKVCRVRLRECLLMTPNCCCAPDTAG